MLEEGTTFSGCASGLCAPDTLCLGGVLLGAKAIRQLLYLQGRQLQDYWKALNLMPSLILCLSQLYAISHQPSDDYHQLQIY